MKPTWTDEIENFQLVKDKVLNNLVEIASTYTDVNELNDIIKLVELSDEVLKAKDDYINFQNERIRKLEKTLNSYKELLRLDMEKSMENVNTLFDKAITENKINKTTAAVICKNVDEVSDNYKKPSEHELMLRNTIYKTYNKLL